MKCQFFQNNSPLEFWFLKNFRNPSLFEMAPIEGPQLYELPIFFHKAVPLSIWILYKKLMKTEKYKSHLIELKYLSILDNNVISLVKSSKLHLMALKCGQCATKRNNTKMYRQSCILYIKTASFDTDTLWKYQQMMNLWQYNWRSF